MLPGLLFAGFPCEAVVSPIGQCPDVREHNDPDVQ